MTKILLTESISSDEVKKAIQTHERIKVNYHAETVPLAEGDRIVEVYAYGITKSGKECMRVYQPYGDTSSKVPHWKLMLLSGVLSWQPTGFHFFRPAPDYNHWGDDTMAQCLLNAQFDKKSIKAANTQAQQQQLYRTDTEVGLDNLRKQLELPKPKIQLDKNNNPIKPVQQNSPEIPQEQQPEVYKTDGEMSSLAQLNKLKQQLQNAPKINLSNYSDTQRLNNQTNSVSSNSGTDDMRNDITNNFNRNAQITPENEPQNQQEPQEPVFKTNTELQMDRLKQQLQNPQKIDLTKIPKK